MQPVLNPLEQPGASSSRGDAFIASNASTAAGSSMSRLIKPVKAEMHHNAVVPPLHPSAGSGPARPQSAVCRRGAAHLIHDDSGDCLHKPRSVSAKV